MRSQPRNGTVFRWTVRPRIEAVWSAVLTLGAGLALALGVVLAGGGAEAQPRQLQVIISAVFKKSFDQFVVPKMRELYNVDVAASPFLSAETLAKSIAQKDNPQTSVLMLDEGPWLQGKQAGLWETLDPAKIPPDPRGAG